MNVGFNHNIMYKGDVFHIQTEDSGIKTPHIITLLYRGGTIISSKKTSYADIIKMENLGQVVEELMKEQHKDMLRRLKSGEFDGRAFPSADADASPTAEAQAPPTAEAQAPPTAEVQAPPTADPSAPVAPPPSTPSTAGQPQAARHKQSLDEIILDYLVVGDD